MINEGEPSGRLPESAATGLSIDLFGNQPKEEEQGRGQIYLVDPEAIIAGYSLKDEVEKMIQLYSSTHSKSGLTRDQFKLLARDLYETVDKQRELTPQELDNLANLLDTDKNELISRSEIMDIVQNEKVFPAKNGRAS